ncbi:hypothetical protein [Trichoplusia ni ascovirus 2c]|uniref:hypothetical protein n=1 Tax=Trichoplusia ni ascovirus 2c TaxID=328615 RepID=UPI0000E441F4|nr:hypothetical protein TNAV2c_gp028 [Trichoplusia ni ascovirus 2c]ABF70545.1 hypothetical protein [Trichoplusia ni ascovirus 2c]AUS94130.1 hypothetical protein [Trichoplusia ni ascovirus 6b]
MTSPLIPCTYEHHGSIILRVMNKLTRTDSVRVSHSCYRRILNRTRSSKRNIVVFYIHHYYR